MAGAALAFWWQMVVRYVYRLIGRVIHDASENNAHSGACILHQDNVEILAKARHICQLRENKQ